MPSRSPTGSLLAVLALAAALTSRPPAATAQQPETPGFAGSERVTAVDLLVEAPPGIAAGDLTVLEAGRKRPVVAVERPDEAEPWRLVVYFELPLAEPEGVRWAAEALAGQAGELVDLGEVEVVVADPEPRTVLPPTRDAGAVADALAAVATRARAGDELVELRRRIARELAGADGGGDEPRGELAATGAELARAAAAEEARFVEERADALLLRMVATAGEPGVGARRALLLVTAGWDPEPSAFYRARLGGAAGSEVAGTEDPGGEAAGAKPWPEGTGATTDALGRTLAAYGWVTLALATPVPDEPEWHLRRRAQVAIDRLHRPDEGEAYLELGRVLAEQGELERAVDAYRDAIHAFYDHPASAPRQAAAEAALGDVLARMGREQEADRWRRRALARDPELASRYPGTAAALADPRAPLAELAETTAGRLVRHDPERLGALESALETLDERVRITYQRPGAPSGELVATTVRHAGRDRPLSAPAWARSGTPHTVAAARLRRFVAGAGAGGTTLTLAAVAGDGGLAVRLDPPAAGLLADPDHRPVLRLSVACGSPEREVAIDHRLLDASGYTAGEPWTHRLGPTDPPAAEPQAVLLEDLASGLWGITPIVPGELGSRSADD